MFPARYDGRRAMLGAHAPSFMMSPPMGGLGWRDEKAGRAVLERVWNDVSLCCAVRVGVAIIPIPTCEIVRLSGPTSARRY